MMATELVSPHWIDAKGNARNLLKKLAGWATASRCFLPVPGLVPRLVKAANGFPTLKRLVDAMTPHGFGFAAIQTVFEGAHQHGRTAA